MDALSIMDLAAELEERVALLYHRFSEHFRASQGGFMFWEQMSLEEKKHADMARTYRRQHLLIPVSRGEYPWLARDLDAAQRFTLEQLGQVEREHIREALEVASEVERMLARAHLARIAEVSDPLLNRLLGKLGREDALHQERILRMMRGV